MAPGLRKERKHISAISYIRKTISIMVWYAKSRRPRHRYMIVRLIYLLRMKWCSEIEDILGQRLKAWISQWNAGQLTSL
jgi:hypothetical protein